MSGKRIGEILVEKRLITPAQLEDALKEQKGTNQFLGYILVHRELITEEDLSMALA